MSDSGNSNKISLRPFQLEDAEVLSKLCNNKKIHDNLRDYIPYPYSKEDAINFIRHCQVHHPALNFAITHSKEFCGTIGLLPQTDVYTGTAEIGYWLGEQYWGKGIMKSALAMMVNYGFEQLGLRRIFTTVYSHNIASMKVLEKTGFVFEGIGRQAIIKNGIIRNEHHYGIIREDLN